MIKESMKRSHSGVKMDKRSGEVKELKKENKLFVHSTSTVCKNMDKRLPWSRKTAALKLIATTVLRDYSHAILWSSWLESLLMATMVIREHGCDTPSVMKTVAKHIAGCRGLKRSWPYHYQDHEDHGNTCCRNFKVAL